MATIIKTEGASYSSSLVIIIIVEVCHVLADDFRTRLYKMFWLSYCQPSHSEKRYICVVTCRRRRQMCIVPMTMAVS